MIDRPHIVLLLGAVIACTAGCSTSPAISSKSMASDSDTQPKSMMFTADAPVGQSWSSVAEGDKSKMTFSMSDGDAVMDGQTLPKGRTLPAGMAFTSIKPGSDNGKVMQDPDKEVPQLSPADQQRYNEVAVKLVMAINDEDSAAYRALFTDQCWKESIAWWREMFAAQTSRYGRIARAFAPHRGFLKFGGMAFRGDLGDNEATIVIHFEEPFGAALTIALNEEGLISRTNIYAKQELAFLDPGEDKVIFKLDE